MSILPKLAESARFIAAQFICPIDLNCCQSSGAKAPIPCASQTRALLVFDEAWLNPNLWNRDKRR
jgi:hypothetical protein